MSRRNFLKFAAGFGAVATGGAVVGGSLYGLKEAVDWLNNINWPESHRRLVEKEVSLGVELMRVTYKEGDQEKETWAVVIDGTELMGRDDLKMHGSVGRVVNLMVGVRSQSRVDKYDYTTPYVKVGGWENNLFEGVYGSENVLRAKYMDDSHSSNNNYRIWRAGLERNGVVQPDGKLVIPIFNEPLIRDSNDTDQFPKRPDGVLSYSLRPAVKEGQFPEDGVLVVKMSSESEDGKSEFVGRVEIENFGQLINSEN